MIYRIAEANESGAGVEGHRGGISGRFSAVARSVADRRTEWAWIHSGRQGPLPARAKRALIRTYARRFGLHTLVETGTYLGDTVAALRRNFTQVYSIELEPDLALRAQRRFQHVPHVTILQGDSASVLPRLLESLAEPALFWLDGHYSGGVTACGPVATPIVAELEAIIAHPMENHVMLVDDAAWLQTQLGGNGIRDLFRLIHSALPGWSLEVRDDVIRAHAAL